MEVALVWFRQDLRLTDHHALNAAIKSGLPVVAVYILDSSIGSAQKWWLHHSLTSLSYSLKKLGVQLVLRSGSYQQEFDKLSREVNIKKIYCQCVYEPSQLALENKLAKQFELELFQGALLTEPSAIKNKSGDYFKVFTPYWRHCLTKINVNPVLPAPKKIKAYSIHVASEKLSDWQLLPTKPDWSTGFKSRWQPGEQGGQSKLDDFIAGAVDNYKEARDVPALLGTSCLSPYLHFGEVSPNMVWSAVQVAIAKNETSQKDAECFLSELGWREFSYYLLFYFPSLPEENFRSQFDKFQWRANEKHLKAWQKGLTGYPIVDAGMRELWHTGYMHNRVRMIVASFLIKDLLIDWRDGAAWFWDTLVDADLASNSASWQWVAGSGADAAPYFRIFNPALQGKKFDPKGEYVKRWVPELKEVQDQHVHEPWLLKNAQLKYPQPIVDHKAARNRALALYKKITGKSG